jgi:branched-chain amino acid transport system substrate-binding protein
VHRRQLLAAGITLSGAAIGLTACGTRTETPTTPGGSTANKVVKIGVIAPLSGDLSALGLGIRNSVDLAIKQANAANAIPGWTIEIAPEDDEAKPDSGRNAATKLASDKDVIGVVGPLNSSVGQTVAPVLNSAGVAEVSPANTNPNLTRGEDPLKAPKRVYPTYFRTCTTDFVQGPFAAQYLIDAGIKEVATIHDKKAYGQGLVQYFSEEFTGLGGTIVATATVNPDDDDFNAAITVVKAKNPKAVFYGGEYPQGGPLSNQMKAAGLKVPLMGGDGIYDPKFIADAGAGSDGDLATSVGAPVEDLDSAKAFIDAYAAGGYTDPYAAYGGYSYDAANAIINAIKVSLASASDVASALKPTVEALGKVDFAGATGKVSFDEYGDSTNTTITVYKVTSGKWKAVKTGELS